MKKLSKFTRGAMFLASIAVLAALFTPLWRIDLVAPQYPEGLMMEIWADRLTGEIDIINGLNHYIGMRKIEASQFPELRFLRWVIIGFSVFGLFIALIGRLWALFGYVVLSAIGGTLGLWDFWKWGYAYGHNLDKTAPIEFPDGGFQPPLLGFKQVLNFEIWSMPHAGAWAIFAAGVVAAALLVWELFFRKKEGNETEKAKKPVANVISVIAALTFFTACTAQPKPILYGKDGCDQCRMVIVDPNFGGEVLLKTGKAYKFDDLNCMSWWLQNHLEEAPKIAQKLVIDHERPAEFIAAETAFFSKNEAFKSPMRADVAAFSSKEKAGNEAMDWTAVATLFKK